MSEPTRPTGIFTAADIDHTHIGHLVTVEHHEIVRSRGYLTGTRPATPDDLTAKPGHITLTIRARRGHRAAAPEWKLVVPPDASVLVHAETAPDPRQPPTGGEAA